MVCVASEQSRYFVSSFLALTRLEILVALLTSVRNFIPVCFDHELWPILARLEALYSRNGAKSFTSTNLRRIFEPLCGDKLQKHDAQRNLNFLGL